jgi:hypothetical protein
MSQNSPKALKPILEAQCEHCGKKYAAFRKSSRYCSASCRFAAYCQRVDRGGRLAVLEELGNACIRCEHPEPGVKLFVRMDPFLKRRVPLCGFHNSELTKEMFYARVPPADRVSYKRKKRVATAQRNEAQMRALD